MHERSCCFLSSSYKTTAPCACPHDPITEESEHKIGTIKNPVDIFTKPTEYQPIKNIS